MTIASRLLNTGTLLVNGSFDEVSYSTTGITGAYVYNNGVSIATNLFLYTQQLDNANWLNQTTTVTADQAIAPDGSLTADLVTATGLYPTVTTTPGRGSLVFSITSGQVYTVSAYVKYINQQKCVIVNEVGVPTGYVVFDILNGTVAATSAGNSSVTGTITAVGNGWYRITATYTIPATSTAWNPQPVRIGNYDGTNYNGSQMYVWGVQLELSASATKYVGMLGTGVNLNNFAQRVNSSGIEYASGSFDEVSYSASGGTGQLGINGINTGNNIVSYSQQFNQTSKWNSTSGNVTVAINVTPAPENSLTGTKLTEDSVANTRHVITQSIPVTAGALSSTYSASVFAKAGERGNIAIGLKEYTGFTNQATAFFNLSTGTVGSLTASNGASVPTGNITPVGNNWYQCAMSTNLGNATATAIGMEISVANSSSNNTYTGDGTSGLYIWGAQTQQAAAATVYVATGPTANVNLNNFSRRDVSTGVLQVKNIFDEFTGAPVVDSSLVLWLDAGQTSSYPGTGTTWTDLSGSGFNGTLTSGPTYNASNGGSIAFNGSTNYVENGVISLTSGTAITVAVWVNCGSSQMQYADILDYNHSPTGGFVIQQDSNTLNAFYFAYYNGSGFDVTPTITVPTNTWCQLVFVKSGTSTIGYLNSVNTVSYTGSANFTGTGYNLNWGRCISIATRYLNGKIATVMIYNRALSSNEVTTNYNALRGRYGI